MEILLNISQITKIDETLKDFKVLLSRYREVKDDEKLLRMFFVRNRNPIWDITKIKFFKTGLSSESAKIRPKNELVDDHFIQRSMAMKFIFSVLDKNEDMKLGAFINLLRKYCSTVVITKDEHLKVSLTAKRNPNYLNYESYLACGITINGLSDHMLKG